MEVNRLFFAKFALFSAQILCMILCIWSLLVTKVIAAMPDTAESIYIWPVQQGTVIGEYRPDHSGIDISGAMGTPIYAARSGIVSHLECDHLLGYSIMLQHYDGSRSLYAHNRRLLVKVNQTVHQGEIIALLGNTGSSPQPNLHFEIHDKGDRPINPLLLLPHRP